ncbi:MAG TPA: alkaline phosphatase family protein [Candidatus Angelobacter sp.]|nr:alkaline phosphatase family protein [Candidatus Angelobacter sp.]
MNSPRYALVVSLLGLFTSFATNLSHAQATGCSAVADQTVNICVPVSGVAVNSPTLFSAAALDKEHPVTAMILYVDSQKQASSTNATLSASVALATGNHAIVIRAWDSTGLSFSSQETITVVAPTVAIAASPVQIAAGETSTLMVSGQNVATIVITNNLDSTSVTLPGNGGTVSVTPSQTATYTATATGATGATTTASTAIAVLSKTDFADVRHVIFMLQENRSFDHYFGMLNPYRRAHNFNVGDDGHVYDVDGIDDKLASISNKDDAGDIFPLFHATSSCLDDMTSSWLESYGDVNRFNFAATRPILMDGFVHTAEGFAKSGAGSGVFTDTTGQRAMAFYEDVDSTGANPELNYYYYMASQFALSDRWFSPVSSKSIPNRIASISGGTTQGYVFDPANDDHAPQLGAKTIFELLDGAHVSWKIYYSHLNANGTPSAVFEYFSYSNKFVSRNAAGQLVIDATHIAPISQYFLDVQNDTLPQFAYIETDFGVSDEHPGSGQSILSGQQEVAKIINSLMFSPSWGDSVFFLSFDEAGGPYDHVPPVPGHTNQNTSALLATVEGDVRPIAVNPDGFSPCLPQTAGVFTNHCDLRAADPGAHPGDAAMLQGFAAQIGFRLPNMIISPYTRRHYVGHAAMDHTAVLRFLEERFNLSPLTKRDAAQPSLLDFFDFTNKPWATPPAQNQIPVPPAVGTTCHPATFH